jgi:transcriptional regulator GlxA family with amidase domain
MASLRVKSSASLRATLNGSRAPGADTARPQVPEGRIRRVLAMIESNPACRMSDLALELNLSESRLQHLFKQKTGVGLGHLLTEKRLQKAAELLAHTTRRIKEIAAAVGYEHTSSFTRAFEQRFSRAPNAYRREIRATDL